MSTTTDARAIAPAASTSPSVDQVVETLRQERQLPPETARPPEGTSDLASVTSALGALRTHLATRDPGPSHSDEHFAAVHRKATADKSKAEAATAALESFKATGRLPKDSADLETVRAWFFGPDGRRSLSFALGKLGEFATPRAREAADKLARDRANHPQPVEPPKRLTAEEQARQQRLAKAERAEAARVANIQKAVRDLLTDASTSHVERDHQGIARIAGYLVDRPECADLTLDALRGGAAERLLEQAVELAVHRITLREAMPAMLGKLGRYAFTQASKKGSS